MTRQRTSAEIEAGARIAYRRSGYLKSWKDASPAIRDEYLGHARDMLAAADAAAAPAAGVTVELPWDLIDAIYDIERCSDGSCVFGDPRKPLALKTNGGCSCWRDIDLASEDYRALRRLLMFVWRATKAALLTAQPEPGTHDAGQATEGGE